MSISLKFKNIFRLLALFLFVNSFSVHSTYAQGFTFIQDIGPITATSYTGDKPQSKTWEHGGYWWTIIPVAASGGDLAGSWLYRLDIGPTWTKLIRLDEATDVKADIKSIGNITHIILKNEATESASQTQFVKLISIEFVSGSPPTYQLWTSRTSTITIPLKDYAETATIDIDSQGKMWLASDGGGPNNKDIYVRWSDSPYSSWSSFIDMNPSNEQVAEDDICSIIAFGGNKIGVLWSDQILRGFRFKYRNDAASETTWSSIENAAVQGSPGAGLGDDHMNLAVGSDGTIYAAIKTSFNTSGEISIGLLVRKIVGGWDPLYPVQTGGGTRPIVLLDENEELLTVFYSDSEAGGDIQYKESPINNISFPSSPTDLTANFNFNDATSTKQLLDGDLVVLYSIAQDPPIWRGSKLIRTPISTNVGAGYSYFLEGINGQGINVNKTSAILTGISAAVTLEAWIKTNTEADQSIINFLEPGGNEGYALTLTADGKIRLQFNNNPSSPFILDSPGNYPIGEWTHLAATFSTVIDTAKIYMNGILIASAFRTQVINNNNNSDDFVIGARDPVDNPPIPYDHPFNGSLDEVRLWNVARTQNEIRSFMSKKFNPSSLPSSLVGYWNFDNPKANSVEDITANPHDGTLVNINSFQWEWSGAHIGDESAFDYTGSGGTFSANISHPDGDDITATTTTGTGIQVYRVDSPPLNQGIPGLFPASNSPFDLSQHRYYGVKMIGSGTPTYDVVYNYQGHPGIFVPLNLRLAFRDNLFDDSWADAGATLNVGLNTLTRTGLQGTEFTLASTDVNPLPVELSSFTGRLVNNVVKLIWRTETETLNFGFDVEKSVDGIAFNKIAFVQGHGNSNSPKMYYYSDPVDQSVSGKLYYRLKQIDTDGTYAYSSIVTVEIGVPSVYELFQNYPNPFNPSTTIRFQIPEKARVILKVYNTIGEEVAELLNEEKEAGYYEVNFSAGSFGNAKNLASGVYIYTILSNEFFASKKMILIK